MTDQQPPATDSDVPTGIAVSLTVYGEEDVTFTVGLTPQGDGALFDLEGGTSVDPLPFTHTFGDFITEMMAAADGAGVDTTTIESDKRSWFDLRDDDTLAGLPASIVGFTEFMDDLGTLFWDDLNDQLDDDAILAQGDLDDEPYGFENGDQETFDRAIMLAQACWLRLNPHDSFVTEISTGDDETPDDETPKGLHGLIEAIAAAFGPTGGSHEYNDGDTGRKSGYSYCCGSHRYETEDIPEHFTARELIEAPRELISLLAAFDVDPRVHAPCLYGQRQEDCAA